MLKLCLVCLIVALTSVASGEVTVGGDAPDFTVQQRVTLDCFKGQQPLVLMFSATGCPWARRELPPMQELQDADLDLAVLVINSERNRDAEFLANFMAQNEFTFPTAPDPTLENAKAYEVAHTPTFFLIDKEGTIAFRHEGSGADLRAALIEDATELAQEGTVSRTEAVNVEGKG